MSNQKKSTSLGETITRSASTQTYYSIRFFVDRDRVQNAFRAYAYFRWADDIIDKKEAVQTEVLAFTKRQRSLLDGLYNGKVPFKLNPEESLLQELVLTDPSRDSGLYIYLDRMMKVMEFDARRKGNFITQSELDDYVENLAVSVTEAMHYFIGHSQYTPQTNNRYLAVSAAHITHMLRDALDDTNSGYYNIPQETLLEGNLTPFDNQHKAYQEWVYSRAKLARTYFDSGRKYLSNVKNFRCRLAGFSYTARFEWVLNTIERENYILRLEYPERKEFCAVLWVAFNTLKSILITPFLKRN
jgi:phytoene/squalene synthetase